MFEVEQLDKGYDLEMAAMLSGTSLSFQKHLHAVFAGLKHLPFSATKSLRSMLDYFSSAGNFEN